MTSKAQEALAEFAQLLDMAPDLRIGQLMAHLGFLSEDEGGRGLGDIEDEELLKVIERHRNELSQLSSAAANQSHQQTGAV